MHAGWRVSRDRIAQVEGRFVLRLMWSAQQRMSKFRSVSLVENGSQEMKVEHVLVVLLRASLPRARILQRAALCPR